MRFNMLATLLGASVLFVTTFAQEVEVRPKNPGSSSRTTQVENTPPTAMNGNQVKILPGVKFYFASTIDGTSDEIGNKGAALLSDIMFDYAEKRGLTTTTSRDSKTTDRVNSYFTRNIAPPARDPNSPPDVLVFVRITANQGYHGSDIGFRGVGSHTDEKQSYDFVATKKVQDRDGVSLPFSGIGFDRLQGNKSLNDATGLQYKNMAAYYRKWATPGVDSQVTDYAVRTAFETVEALIRRIQETGS
jgi:hypothetical protein